MPSKGPQRIATPLTVADDASAVPDRLNRGAYSRLLNALIRELHAKHSGGTIGLMGHWGSGKSTMRNILLRGQGIDAPPLVIVPISLWPLQTDDVSAQIAVETTRAVTACANGVGLPAFVLPPALEDVHRRLLATQQLSAIAGPATDVPAFGQVLRNSVQWRMLARYTAIPLGVSLVIALLQWALALSTASILPLAVGLASLTAGYSTAYVLGLVAQIAVFVQSEVAAVRRDQPRHILAVREGWQRDPSLVRDHLVSISTAVEKNGGLLVIWLEDLDRCSPDAVFKTLSLLSTAFLGSRCVFVVECDDAAVMDHLRSTNRVSPDRLVGWMHRIFGHTIVLREAHQDELEKLVGHYRESLQLPNDAVNDLMRWVGRNPRALRRTMERLAQAVALLRASEVNFPVDQVAWGEVLRELYPDVWRLVTGDPSAAISIFERESRRPDSADADTPESVRRRNFFLAAFRFVNPDWYGLLGGQTSGGSIDEFRSAFAFGEFDRAAQIVLHASVQDRARLAGELLAKLDSTNRDIVANAFGVCLRSAEVLGDNKNLRDEVVLRAKTASHGLHMICAEYAPGLVLFVANKDEAWCVNAVLQHLDGQLLRSAAESVPVFLKAFGEGSKPRVRIRDAVLDGFRKDASLEARALLTSVLAGVNRCEVSVKISFLLELRDSVFNALVALLEAPQGKAGEDPRDLTSWREWCGCMEGAVQPYLDLLCSSPHLSALVSSMADALPAESLQPLRVFIIAKVVESPSLFTAAQRIVSRTGEPYNDFVAPFHHLEPNAALAALKNVNGIEEISDLKDHTGRLIVDALIEHSLLRLKNESEEVVTGLLQIAIARAHCRDEVIADVLCDRAAFYVERMPKVIESLLKKRTVRCSSHQYATWCAAVDEAHPATQQRRANRPVRTIPNERAQVLRGLMTADAGVGS